LGGFVPGHTATGARKKLLKGNEICSPHLLRINRDKGQEARKKKALVWKAGKRISCKKRGNEKIMLQQGSTVNGDAPRSGAFLGEGGRLWDETIRVEVSSTEVVPHTT